MVSLKMEWMSALLLSLTETPCTVIPRAAPFPALWEEEGISVPCHAALIGDISAGFKTGSNVDVPALC